MERKVDIDKNNSLVALGMYAWYMCVCVCVCIDVSVLYAIIVSIGQVFIDRWL